MINLYLFVWSLNLLSYVDISAYSEDYDLMRSTNSIDQGDGYMG